MKNLTIIIFSIISIFTIYSADTDFKFTGDYSVLRNLYSPADEGSENEKKFINYIENVCKSMNLNCIESKIENEDMVSSSKNIEIRINAEKKTEDEIIIICSLDSPIIRQEHFDNSISQQIMFNLIKIFKNKPLTKNLVFLFSGANERENPGDYFGLQTYISKKKDLSHTFIIVLDVLSNKSKIRFTGSINKKPIPSKILNDFIDSDKKNINFYINKNEIIKSRFGLLEVEDFASYLISNNAFTVSFSNRENTVSNIFTGDETYAKNLTEYFNSFILKVDGYKLPIDPDYNYQFVSIFDKHFIIQEYTQIVIFLVLIFMVILLRNVLPIFQRLRIHLIINIFPYFVFLFMAFYILSFFPYALLLPLEKITGIQHSFFNLPVLYFVNIFVIPLIIILILKELINKLPFPKHNYLYIYGAIIFCFLNLLIFLIIDISLVYLYLWSVIAITLSNFTGKKYILKFFFYIIAPLPLILLLVNLSLNSDIQLIKNSFSRPFLQHFLFCLFTFPFLLLFMRMEIITKYKYRLFYSKTTIIVIMITLIIVSGIFFISYSLIIFPEEKNVFATLFSSKGKTELQIESKGNIGGLETKTDDGIKRYLLNKNNLTVKLHDIPKTYTVNYSFTNVVGGNLLYSFKINSITNIEYLNIYLIVPESFNPLESNYAYKKIEKTKYRYDPKTEEVYTFLIPRNTGTSFNLTAILLPSKKYRMYFEISYPYIDKNIIELDKKEGYIYKNTEFIDKLVF
jgi:hypothetical protein